MEKFITDGFLFVAQKKLRDLKAKISAQSKKNFVLERDVRYLDSRIALLIQNVGLFFFLLKLEKGMMADQVCHIVENGFG